MQKYSKIALTKVRKKEFVKISFKDVEQDNDRSVYENRNTKESNRPINKEMSDSLSRMIPHLMFASEFADGTLKLNGEMDYEKWFKDHDYLDDPRFTGIEVVAVDFITKDNELTGVQIHGKRITQLTDNPFSNPFKTPVINLNKDQANYYKLVTILDEQIQDLILAIDKYMERGNQLANNQLKIA